MSTAKRFLLGFAAILLGGVLLFNGVREYRQGRRLQSEGQSVTAKVVDERTVYRTKGRSRYYLTVEFETEDRQSITRELKGEQLHPHRRRGSQVHQGSFPSE